MLKKISSAVSNSNKIARNIRTKPTQQTREIGSFFADKTLKQCSVNIKPRGWSEEFCEILPQNYTYVDRNGRIKVNSVLEIDWLEASQKGQGDGSRKIQEIIDYAKQNTDGRLIVTTAQYGEHKNPLLFYYRNGLRSNSEKVNNILEQVDLGLRPKSDLPKNAFMFLPKI